MEKTGASTAHHQPGKPFPAVTVPMAMISSLNDWNRPMASYKETFSAYYDALTEDVDRL